MIEITLPSTLAENPSQILAATQKVERELGRPDVALRDVNAPRTIDIDILYLGAAVVDTPELQLPHPRTAVRRFVLEPLADIRPDILLPGFGATPRALLSGLQSTEPALTLYASEW